MSARESRPAGAAPESARTEQESTEPRPLLLTADERQAAYCAGYEDGMRAKVDALAEQRAGEILHEEACAALGFARRAATERHGPAWAELVCGPDGGDDG